LDIGNSVSKDGSRGGCLLERVENIIAGEIELPRNVLPDEVCQ